MKHSARRASRRSRPRALRKLRVASRRLMRDQQGTTALEWALLLAVIALPSVYLLTMCLSVIVDHYRMVSMISSLPLP